MTAFSNLSIRRKLFRLTLASTATAVALAEFGFMAWDINRFRSDVRQDMDAQARIVSENSAAPLTFGDERAAGETLAVLRLRPQVTTACLYTADGRLFATYHRTSGECPPAAPPQTRFGWDRYDAVVPVAVDAERVGTLYIRRELGDLYAQMQLAGATALLLLLFALGAAFLVARRLQRSIASPLLDLADTARAISSTRDYSLRAAKTSGDEIGVVVRAFNEMLDRLGEQEAERTAALDRERQANRLKDEFLATLSHELRTPLNAVLGWTRVLQTSPDAAKQGRAIESIERNARAQAKLIEDLLEVSRIVTGKLQLNVRPVDLAAIVDAAVEIVQPAAAAKRIHLTCTVDARPALTMGDPDRLQQVVWNLLSNAIKFTDADGWASVSVRHTGGYTLTVRDSGRGIEPSFLPHVFETFRQADATASREHGGLGLGLAIAKQLVELHGGTIRAASPGPGGGATFEVTLPSAVRAEREAAHRVSAAGAADGSLLRNVRVLVVDDDEDARTLLELALTEYGADVATAHSAADAIAKIQREAPDVLLSDIGMPGEDGYALIQRVRAQPASAGGSVPAIAITAYASAADRDAALAAGFQGHFAKPLDVDAVAAFVAALRRS
jgi:signal transduction histidine kinase/CheY-like chemotaxis protein